MYTHLIEQIFLIAGVLVVVSIFVNFIYFGIHFPMCSSHFKNRAMYTEREICLSFFIGLRCGSVVSGVWPVVTLTQLTYGQKYFGQVQLGLF